VFFVLCVIRGETVVRVGVTHDDEREHTHTHVMSKIDFFGSLRRRSAIPNAPAAHRPSQQPHRFCRQLRCILTLLRRARIPSIPLCVLPMPGYDPCYANRDKAQASIKMNGKRQAA